MADFYVTLCLAFNVCAAIWITYRFGIISPLSIFSWYTSLGIFYFFYTQTLGIIPQFELSVMPLQGLRPHSIPVAELFFFLGFLGVVTSLSLPAKRVSVNISFRRSNFIKMLPSAPIISFGFLVLCIEVAHFIDIDASYFLSYSGYHTINDLATVHINTTLGAFFHKLGPLMCSLCLALAIICLSTKRQLVGLGLLMISAYGFLLAVASSSREIAVFFVLAGLARLVVKGRAGLFFWAMMAGAGIAILFAISARGQPMQGLEYVFDNLAAVKVASLPDLLIGILSNVAHGAVNFANFLTKNPTYPLSYKITSLFSPLPGNIDHYDQIAQNALVMISHANPPSAFSETYFFGLPYLVIFSLAVMFVLRLVTKRLMQTLSIANILLLAVSALLIYRMYDYPTRISNRMFVLIGMILLVDWFIRRLRVKERKGMATRRSSRKNASATLTSEDQPSSKDPVHYTS